MKTQPLTYISTWTLIIGLLLAALCIGAAAYAFAKKPGHRGSIQAFMIGLGIAAPTVLIALFVPESVLLPLACISFLILGGVVGLIWNLALAKSPHDWYPPYAPWPPNPPYDWHNPPYAEIVLGKERVKRLTPGLRGFQVVISLASIGMGLFCLALMIFRWLGWW